MHIHKVYDLTSMNMFSSPTLKFGCHGNGDNFRLKNIFQTIKTQAVTKVSPRKQLYKLSKPLSLNDQKFSFGNFN